MTTVYHPYWKSANSKPVWEEDPGEKPARCTCNECEHCMWGCEDCTYCADPCEGSAPGCITGEDCCTPSYFVVTVEGVTGPSACYECAAVGSGNSLEDFTFSGVNGTFTLPQTSACVWEAITGSVSWNLHLTTSDCSSTGDDAVAFSGSFRAKLTKTGSSSYRFDIEGENFNRAGPNVTAFARGTIEATLDCSATVITTGDAYTSKSAHCAADQPVVITLDDTGATATIKPCGGTDTTEIAECPTPAGCPNSSCCTGDEMEVVFTDVNASACSASVALDGAHTLSQSEPGLPASDPCVWTGTVANGYGGAADIAVVLTKTASGWTLTATSSGDGIFNGTGTNTNSWDCTDVAIGTNSLDCDDSNVGADGGSATGSACP
jgi:hypothetical protein